MEYKRLSLELYRQASRDELNAVHGLRHGLIEPALCIPKSTSKRRLRHQPKPNLVGHQNNIARCPHQPFAEQSRFVLDVPFSFEQVGQPEREAIDENDIARATFPVQHTDKVDGFLNRAPACRTVLLMTQDASGHFIVPRFSRREIDARIARRFSQHLRASALARTRSAKNKGRHHDT